MPGTAGQSSTDRERRVRQEAYRIWEEAGRPEGRADEHWAEAAKRVDAERPNGPQQARIPTEAELTSAKAAAKKASAPKPGGRRNKPVSPGG